MKELIASAFYAFVILTASASTDPAEINEQATGIARSMANQVGLNELEYIQVKKYTAEKLARIAEIKDLYVNDHPMMYRKIAAMETAYQYRIQNLLSAKQFDAYAALHNNLKPNVTIIAPD